VLVIISDTRLRERVVQALRFTGLLLVSAGRVAEVERWPAGEVVITDLAHFTPFWKTVGATHVIVLADTSAEGTEACRCGATAWLLRSSGAEALMVNLRATLDAIASEPPRRLRAI
jgi:hypothetical protein